VHEQSLIIGVISDTHGRLSTAALCGLEGVDRIIHAGDIGGTDVLDALARIAPVTMVRGNMDGGAWAKGLKATEVVEIGPVLLYVLHDLYGLDLEPEAAGFQAVICGHTHLPASELKNGVLYLNPGSASLPRHGHPPTVARVRVRGDRLIPEFIRLDRI
jgi:putative phosphoesterase